MSTVKELFGGAITMTLPSNLIDASWVLPMRRAFDILLKPILETFDRFLILRKSSYTLMQEKA